MSDYKFYRTEPESGFNQIVNNLSGNTSCYFTYYENGKPRIAIKSDNACQTAMRNASSATGWKWSNAENQNIPNVVLIELPSGPVQHPNPVPVLHTENQGPQAEKGQENNNMVFMVGGAFLLWWMSKKKR